MKTISKTIITAILASGMFVAGQANAEYRSDRHYDDNNYRSQSASYHDGYHKDRHGYRDSHYRGVDHGYKRRGYKKGYRKPHSRVVHRKTYPTRYDARVFLVEEIYYTRSGREQLVCSVGTKGYERDYISRKSLKRIAKRNCSRYSRIQYL